MEVEVALSEKDRSKRADRAAQLISPGTVPRTLVQGSGHFRMTTTAGVILGLFAVAFLVGLLLGRILIPGVLVILVVWAECRPGRDLVVTDGGLALFHRSFLTGRPRRVIAMLPLAPVYAGTPTGPVELELGPERIKLPRKEYDRLALAMGSPGTMPAPPGPIAP